MSTQNAIITTHNLDFEGAESPYAKLLNDDHKLFRIGTCGGQYGYTSDSFYIISVINKEPNNGHLNDVFEWFEYSCKTSGRNLLVLECMNEDFYQHLLTKRGFLPLDKDKKNCIKVFNKAQYKKLLKRGNEIIMAGSLKCV